MKKRRETKPKELRVIFKQVDGVSEAEMQQKLFAVFDILLNEVGKQKKINSK